MDALSDAEAWARGDGVRIDIKKRDEDAGGSKPCFLKTTTDV